MKKLFSLAVAALALSSAAFAQDKGGSQGTAISVGLEAGLPIGKFGNSGVKFSDAYKFGIGGSAKVAIPIFENGAVTLSAGYISFSGKSETIGGVTFKNPALSMIPLKAGLRYTLGNTSGFYIEPQLGYSIAKVKGASESASGFTYAANVGMLINNMIDLALRYEGASLNKSVGTVSHIGLRAAYSFNLSGK